MSATVRLLALALLTPGAASFFHGSTVAAQGLGQQDLLPAMGASWHMKALQAVPVEPEPEDPLVWPYADLVGNDLYGTTQTVIAPGTVPGNSAYPLADRAVRVVRDDQGPSTVVFYDVRTGDCRELGSLSEAVNTVSAEGVMVLAYPMEQGEVVDGAFCYTLQSTGGLSEYCGTTRISAKAQGRLELNFGIFDNAQLITARRAVALAGSTDTTVTISKDWYAEGIPYPLLHITEVINSDGTTGRSAQLLDPSSVVGIGERRAAEPLALQPNPAVGRVRLDPGGPSFIELIASNGQVVEQIRTRDHGLVTLGLEGIPEGLFTVRVTTSSGLRTARLVILH